MERGSFLNFRYAAPATSAILSQSGFDGFSPRLGRFDRGLASTRSDTVSAMPCVKLRSTMMSPSRWAVGPLATARREPKQRRHMDGAIEWRPLRQRWREFLIRGSTPAIYSGRTARIQTRLDLNHAMLHICGMAKEGLI